MKALATARRADKRGPQRPGGREHHSPLRGGVRAAQAARLIWVAVGLLLGFALVTTAWAQGTAVPEGQAVDGTIDAIRLDSVHMIAESFGEVLRISEIHLFGNGGDQAYVGESGDPSQGTVFIPLPQNAVGVGFGEDVAEDRFLQVEGGLMDTEPVPPGTESSVIFFSYHLMVTGETVSLERRFAYPVANFNILVVQPGLTVNSDQLQFLGIEQFEGRQYEVYTAEDLGHDAPLGMEFVPVEIDNAQAGMPPSSARAGTGAATRGNQRLLLWIGVALAALTVVGAMIYPQVARRSAATPVPASSLASSPRARRLLTELADLEDAFEAGQIDEVTYERQRSEKREELKSL